MFVTVFLVEPRVHIVVPKKFIYQLVQVNLDNVGINCNQNRRIYFSGELFEALKNGVVLQEEDFLPNFDVPITKIYPLPNDVLEACYIARLKKFWVSFDDAWEHAERLRRQLPPLYNPVRLHEQPIPPVIVAQDGYEYDVANTSGDELPEENLVENDSSDEENRDEIAPNNLIDEMKNEPFEVVVMNQDDMNAVDNLFETPIEPPIDLPIDPLLHASINNSDADSHSEDDEIEITFKSLNDFRPKTILDGYELKLNDVLCNNIPFKINPESGDRSFKVDYGREFKNVLLSVRLVNGLTKLNVEKRNDIDGDKVFLKALLIGLFTVKRIKESSPLEVHLLGFMKDLFEHRVSEEDLDGERLTSFQRLVDMACDELRENRI